MRLGLGLGLGKWGRVPPPQLLSLSADAVAVWPDYVAVAAIVANADSVRFELDGYTTQTVTAAQAAAGIRLQSDGTAPVVANGGDNALSTTPLRGSTAGLSGSANVQTWKADLEAWLGGYGINHAGGEINTWTGQVAGTLATAASNHPDRVAEDPLFRSHDTVDFDGTEVMSCSGFAALLANRAAYTVIDVARQDAIATTGYAFSCVNAGAQRLYGYRIAGGAHVMLHYEATSFVSYAAGTEPTQDVTVYRFAGDEPAPKARIYVDGVLRTGAEQGGVPFANVSPNCVTATWGQGAALRLAARFVFGPALDPTLDIAPITAHLLARYVP